MQTGRTENSDTPVNPPAKIAYAIVERKGGGKPIWLNVGRAYNNRDGSINLVLDAMPTNGRLQLRDYEPRPNNNREAA